MKPDQITNIAEKATAAYIEIALWDSIDDEDEPLFDSYGLEDLTPETLARMKKDVESFIEKANKEAPDWPDYWSGTLLGNDFWLTRNGHGTGFWDSPQGRQEEVGLILTKIANGFGPADLYVGDDGAIHHYPPRSSDRGTK